MTYNDEQVEKTNVDLLPDELDAGISAGNINLKLNLLDSNKKVTLVEAKKHNRYDSKNE